MSYKQGLSLCMLAHRLEFPTKGGMLLPAILGLHEPHVDEIILADTSEDGRVFEATKDLYPGKLHVSRYPGPLEPLDLGEFRNYTLGLAEYDWIIALDPDETVENWIAVRNRIATFVRGEKEDAYLLRGTLINHDTAESAEDISDMCRLFRNGIGFKYDGETCEVLVLKDGSYFEKYVDCGWTHHKNNETLQNPDWGEP